jgi:hypothetical protein
MVLSAPRSARCREEVMQNSKINDAAQDWTRYSTEENEAGEPVAHYEMRAVRVPSEGVRLRFEQRRVAA